MFFLCIAVLAVVVTQCMRTYGEVPTQCTPCSLCTYKEFCWSFNIKEQFSLQKNSNILPAFCVSSLLLELNFMRILALSYKKALYFRKKHTQ